MRRVRRILPPPCLLAGIAVCAAAVASPVTAAFRSPVDVVTLAAGLVATANAASGSVSLVDVAGRRVIAEAPVGRRPAALAARGPTQLLVTTLEAGDLVLLDADASGLREAGRLRLGYEPHGLVVTPDGGTAYVVLSATGEIAVVDLETLQQTGSIPVGRLPRQLALSPDAATLAVTCSGSAELVLVDRATATVRSRQRFKGLNLGQPAFTADGAEILFPWTYDGGSHPSPGNIRLGWVTGSRLGRLTIAEGEETLAGLTLDVAGRAVGDVSGLVVVDDGGTVLVTAGGTHELLRFTTGDLPWTQISGTEVMDRGLAADESRFRRLVVGGRPLGIAVAGGTAVVANALRDEVQCVDLASFTLSAAIPLAAGEEHTAEELLVRSGEEIFFDAGRSLDQWYSCHTCHFEGGGNTVTMDTLNDGSTGSYKTVLPLWRLAETGPWTWHGWQEDLRASLHKSLVETMRGPEPSAADVVALEAYLARLEPPPSPFREPDGGLSPAAERGRALFASSRANCLACHTGDRFTSPEVFDVGLIRPADRYPGFSPPTLQAAFRKTLFLHNGRARSLRDVLTGLHAPDKVSGTPPLSDAEIDDLVAYLMSL